MSSPTSLDVLTRSFLFEFPRHAARKIETMVPAEAAQVLDEQPVYLLQPVMESLAPGVADALLLQMSPDKVGGLLESLDPGVCAAILSRFDQESRDRFISFMEPSIGKEIGDLLEYPADSAGRLMDPRVVAFNASATVDETIGRLKNQNVKTLQSLFLLDDSMRLCGQVDVSKLALASGEQRLLSLADPIRAVATVLDPRDEIVDKVQKLRISALPVVDGKDRLVGTIYETDIFDALKETLSTDLQTMVGVSKDERALSSAWFAVKKRQPWLQINLLTAFLASAVVGVFESTIAQYTALAILLPIAAGQSGNTGAQALAVTMRGLTLREITVRHWLRVGLKETGAAFVNGTAIALTCGTCVFFWSQSLGLALIISLAMVSSMTIAAVSGAMVPIVLKRIGQDPALSSSIILTTITDIAGFISFLGIATLLSGMLETG